MTNLIHNEKSPMGCQKEKVLTFSTVKTNKNKKYISLIKVLTDKNGIIHGLNIQYDDQFTKEKLYPKSIEENLLISIEMNLSLLIENRNNFGNKKFTKETIYFIGII